MFSYFTGVRNGDFQSIRLPILLSVKDVLKFMMTRDTIKSPMKASILVHEFWNVNTVTCVYILVRARPSLAIELRDIVEDTVVETVNFTGKSEELTDRQVLWTLQPGSYQLYLLVVRVTGAKSTIDAALRTVDTYDGKCEDVGK